MTTGHILNHIYDKILNMAAETQDHRLIMCHDCEIEYDVTGSQFLRPLHDEHIGTACDICSSFNSDSRHIPCSKFTEFIWLYTQPSTDDDPNNHAHRAFRQERARAAAKFIRGHDIPAHDTLCGAVRALDTYTYRDDNNILCYGYEWRLIDSMDTGSVYEFLNY